MSGYVIAKYIRLSLEDSKYESLSIPNQRLLLDTYIDSLGIDNAEVLEFVDNGYTGTNFDRPAFQIMMAAINNGEVNCIIAKDISRISFLASTGLSVELVRIRPSVL